MQKSGYDGWHRNDGDAVAGGDGMVIGVTVGVSGDTAVAVGARTGFSSA